MWEGGGNFEQSQRKRGNKLGGKGEHWLFSKRKHPFSPIIGDGKQLATLGLAQALMVSHFGLDGKRTLVSLFG